MSMDAAMEPMSLGALFAMWTIMMTLMMLPGAMPAILRQAGALARIRFAAGYFAIWTAFSAGAAILHWILQSKALLSEDMVVRSSLAAGVTLVAVGLYQITPWKHRFLLECRAARAAQAASGLRYGLSCLGSSAVLMGLMWIAGAMSYAFMAALAIWIAAEKSLPWGARLPWAGAVALIGWGGAVIAMTPA